MNAEKYCQHCKQTMDTCNFNANRSTKDGFSRWCKACTHEYDSEDITTVLQVDNPFGLQITRQVWNQIHRTYSIEWEEYFALFNKQEGLCAGCNRHASNFNKGLHVDHEHVSGKVRGLLCGNCNRSLGLIRDNPNLLLLMRDYLLKHSQKLDE